MAIFVLKWNLLSFIERDTDCDFHTFANIFVVGLYQRSLIGTPQLLPCSTACFLSDDRCLAAGFLYDSSDNGYVLRGDIADFRQLS